MLLTVPVSATAWRSPMRPADSLRRRIVVAFVSFGIVLSMFFALIAAVAVEGIEMHLVDNRLAEVANWALPRQAAGLAVDLPSGLRFHRGDAIPASLRGLPQGVPTSTSMASACMCCPAPMRPARMSWSTMKAITRRSSSSCIRCSPSFSSASCSWRPAWAASSRAASSTPISELADAVARGRSPLPCRERKDELGILARALEAHTAELRAFLDRERFFTGDVSHELRSPLTVIMGAAEILMTMPANEATRAPAERIYRAAHEAAECVTVLLLLARSPELGRLPPVPVERDRRTRSGTLPAPGRRQAVELRLLRRPGFAIQAPPNCAPPPSATWCATPASTRSRAAVTVALSPRRVVVEDTGPGCPSPCAIPWRRRRLRGRRFRRAARPAPASACRSSAHLRIPRRLARLRRPRPAAAAASPSISPAISRTLNVPLTQRTSPRYS
jgi:hypothetical protein